MKLQLDPVTFRLHKAVSEKHTLNKPIWTLPEPGQPRRGSLDALTPTASRTHFTAPTPQVSQGSPFLSSPRRGLCLAITKQKLKENIKAKGLEAAKTHCLVVSLHSTALNNCVYIAATVPQPLPPHSLVCPLHTSAAPPQSQLGLRPVAPPLEHLQAHTEGVILQQTWLKVAPDD